MQLRETTKGRGVGLLRSDIATEDLTVDDVVVEVMFILRSCAVGSRSMGRVRVFGWSLITG